MAAWALIIMLTLCSWDLVWLPIILNTDVELDNSRCRYDAPGCYYDGVVHLDRAVFLDAAEARRVISHELNHRLQCESRIWENEGGWAEFRAEAKRLNIDARRRGYLIFLLDNYQPHDVHAELPWLLDYDIPERLSDWYPWIRDEGIDQWLMYVN